MGYRGLSLHYHDDEIENVPQTVITATGKAHAANPAATYDSFSLRATGYRVNRR